MQVFCLCWAVSFVFALICLDLYAGQLSSCSDRVARSTVSCVGSFLTPALLAPDRDIYATSELVQNLAEDVALPILAPQVCKPDFHWSANYKMIRSMSFLMVDRQHLWEFD